MNLTYMNKRRAGDVGLGQAIAWYTAQGFTVSIPLTDSQGYDLIVDDGTRLLRVQVKTTRRQDGSGVFAVELRTQGGNRSGTGKSKVFCPDNVEALFILTEQGVMYHIPTWPGMPIATISLSAKYDAHRVTYPSG